MRRLDGFVSVLVQRAASDGPRLGYWHASACQRVGRVRKLRAVEPRPSSLLGMTKKEDMREVL